MSLKGSNIDTPGQNPGNRMQSKNRRKQKNQLILIRLHATKNKKVANCAKIDMN